AWTVTPPNEIPQATRRAARRIAIEGTGITCKSPARKFRLVDQTDSKAADDTIARCCLKTRPFDSVGIIFRVAFRGVGVFLKERYRSIRCRLTWPSTPSNVDQIAVDFSDCSIWQTPLPVG